MNKLIRIVSKEGKFVYINPKYIAEVIRKNGDTRIKMQDGNVFYVNDFSKLFKAGIEV